MNDLEMQIGRFIQGLRMQNCSVHTIRAYTSDLKSFPEFTNGAALTEINRRHVTDWMSALSARGDCPKTLRRRVNALRSFFRFVKRAGLVRINPGEQVVLPKTPTRLPEVPTEAQTETLLTGLKDMARIGARPKVERDVLIVELLYGCGLRASELVGTNLDDLDRQDRWIVIRGKGKKERQVPYGSKAHAALEAYLPKRRASHNQNALFVGPGGRRLNVRTVGNIVKKYSSGLLGDSTMHPHSLRHAYANHLLNNGTDLRCLQELLGHSCLSTTQLYTRVSPGRLSAVYDRSHPKAG